MNKEILNEQMMSLEARNPGLEILGPKALTNEETADHLISLLEAMYVKHGITQNREKLITDISSEKVLTWFGKKDNKFVATACLVKQGDGAWELGRAVSLDRGNGIGKKVILEALKFHLENHPGVALTAEVRAAAEFKGIPSGEATQKIFFGTINSILPITPFAVAPLFAHGEPKRNEPFILSASDVKAGKTISEKIGEIINGRSAKGIIPRLMVTQTSPFRQVVPSDEGAKAVNVAAESETFNGCSFFPIEATDRNMPLIGMLSARNDMVLCGVDRLAGKEGKPVILIATLGFQGNIWNGSSTEFAPAKVVNTLPKQVQEDVQHIANKFSHIHNKRLNKFLEDRQKFWEAEMNWPKRDDEVWEG